MKLKLLFILLIFQIKGFAQTDFLILRKRNQTIQTFFIGSYITFQLSNHQWIEGRLKKIKADSLFVDQMILRQVANYWGLPTVDTLKLGLFKISINEIFAMPKQSEKFEFITDGTLLQIGSGGYMGLNIINGLANKEEVFSGNNLTKLGIAAGLFGIGTLLKATHKNECILGKKYMLFSSSNISVK